MSRSKVSEMIRTHREEEQSRAAGAPYARGGSREERDAARQACDAAWAGATPGEREAAHASMARTDEVTSGRNPRC